MRSIAKVLLCLTIISMVLVGCVHQRSIPRSSPQGELAACKISCQQQFNTCNKLCHNSCRQCSAYSSYTTAKHYNHYKSEQFIRGGIIARELNSYRDPLQCRKSTCECAADYRICTQSCAGIIYKRLQVAPTCC